MFGHCHNVCGGNVVSSKRLPTCVIRSDARNPCACCRPDVHERVILHQSASLDQSMLGKGAWAASATALLGVSMYTYQSNLISSAELHALGLSTLAGALTAL